MNYSKSPLYAQHAHHAIARGLQSVVMALERGNDDYPNWHLAMANHRKVLHGFFAFSSLDKLLVADVHSVEALLPLLLDDANVRFRSIGAELHARSEVGQVVAP